MKPKPKSKLHPDNLAAEAIAPLVLYALKNRHAVTDVTNRMNRLAGTKFTRQQIQQYLRADPAKRVEPRHGVGELMRAVTQSLEIDDVIYWTSKGWRVAEKF